MVKVFLALDKAAKITGFHAVKVSHGFDTVQSMAFKINDIIGQNVLLFHSVLLYA